MHTLGEESGYRKRLVAELISRQRRNPAYSLRSFARDLGISPAALSQVLNSKRNFSRTNLTKVIEKLGLSPSEKNRAFQELSSGAADLADDQFMTLHDDVFRFMSDWYYFAI